MEINGHELETKYLVYINQLQLAKMKPNLLNFIWVGRYKRYLTERLKRLEDSFNDGKLSDRAYIIWKKMINDVL